MDTELKCVFILQRADTDDRMAASQGDGSGITAFIDTLHAGHRASRQEIANVSPVIGRSERELERYFIGVVHGAAALMPAQLAWRALVCLLESVIEAAQAAETGGQRDLSDRQSGIVEQPFREMQPACLRHRDRRGAHVLSEQTMQMARPDADAGRQFVHRYLVQRSFLDQPQRAAHHCRGAEPRRSSRRRFRSTAKARAKASLRGSCCSGVVTNVAALRRRGRTDRPAIDAGRGDRDEESSVETRIATQTRSFERAAIETKDVVHGSDDTPARLGRLAGFGRKYLWAYSTASTPAENRLRR